LWPLHMVALMAFLVVQLIMYLAMQSSI
jgi:hypothetical protein